MLHDLRYALRLLIKSPGFSAAAILALGFGIGLSTTVFNVFSATLLRPFPHIKDEERLVFINSQQLAQPDSFYELSMADFLDLRAQSKTLEGLTTTVARTMIFTGSATPERVLGASISVEGFPMLGVEPLRGRLFAPDDAKPGAAPVAILSHSLWQRRYGGRDDAVGRTVALNGAMHTIIGVLPPGFQFPENHEMWVPLLNDQVKVDERGSHDYPGWARLRPGVSLDEARAEVAAIAARLALEHKATNEGKGIALRPVREEATEGIDVLMRLMLGAALFVLLIACANVANLLLARASSRAHEMAIRVSVGATRGRIVRQVLTESVVLGVLGGAFGLLVATWTNSLLFGAVPDTEIPFWMTFDYDWRVLAFVTAAAVGSAGLFGLFPALHASRSTAVELREGGRSTTAGRRARLVRQGLVVAQIALSAVLLIGAGLFIRSFLKLQATDPGFDPRGVITFRVGLPPTQYKDRAEIQSFFDRLGPALEAIPGVVASGSTHMLPGNGNNRNVFVIEGRPIPPNLNESSQAVLHIVSRGYFAAMRIPLKQGRPFTAADRRDSPHVALVDETFVKRWLPGENPVGKRFRVGLPDKDEKPEWIEIVGVVGDVPQQMDRPYELGGYYLLSEQSTETFVNFALRVNGDPTKYGPAIQKAVSSVIPDIPIYNLHTMEYLQRTNYWERRFFSQAFGAFGIGALFLAALGVYGVMAYSVTQRTSEIGVRMALGATESEVLRLVGRQGLQLIGLGMAIGMASALGLTQLIAGLLYGISPSDPPTYFVLSLLLAATGLLACWLPVRRAVRIDPMTALRSE